MGRLLINWQPKIEVVRFNLKQALEIYKVYRETFSKDQPLPTLEEIYQDNLNRLDGCLGSIAHQTINGSYFYRPGIEAASAYFYFVNRSHWLFNGNKRTAIIFTIAYLRIHNKWLQMDWKKLYGLAEETAKFKGGRKKMLEKIKRIFHKSLIDYSEGALNGLLASWETWRVRF